MSGSKLGDKLEELDLSPEEIHKLTEAMKKKEFRDLLAEYAKEIQDPENKVSDSEQILNFHVDFHFVLIASKNLLSFCCSERIYLLTSVELSNDFLTLE